MIFFDFETSSAADLKRCGPTRYAQHPSTRVLCFSYAIDNQAPRLGVPLQGYIPKDLMAALNRGDSIEAHNADFEIAVWDAIMVPRYGWPAVPLTRWVCSAATVAYLSLPRSLEGVAGALNLDEAKDAQGRRSMLRVARQSDKDPMDLATHYERLGPYCVQDVRTERAAVSRTRSLPAPELQLWRFTSKINRRGVRVDLPAIDNARQILALEAAVATRRLAVLTQGFVTSTTQNGKLLTWLKSRGYPLASLDKRALKSFDPNTLEDPRAREVLQIRTDSAKTSTAKYATLAHAACEDGRLRDYLLYHGAITGRWAGKLVQPQNFPRNDMGLDVDAIFSDLHALEPIRFTAKHSGATKLLSNVLRGVFIPSEGCQMFGGDYAGIELRMAFWLAGENEILKKIAQGLDPYVEFAKSVFKSGDIDKLKRGLGKRGMLSGIYSVGWKKLQATFQEFDGISVPDETAQALVNGFRASYPKIKQYWYGLESSALRAVRDRKRVGFKQVSWFLDDYFLKCRLPSGRCLSYPFPEIQQKLTPWGEMRDTLTYMGTNSRTRKWERLHTHGGKLFENVDSGICRDALAANMISCELNGYRVLLSVHDEIVAERPQARGSVKGFADVMSEVPPWIPGFPLAVQAWTGDRYNK